MDSEEVEVLEVEWLLLLSPAVIVLSLVFNLESSEHLERWHLWCLELWHLWHSSLHLLHLFLGGFLKLFLVLMDFLFEFFSGYVLEFLWVPGLFETVDHDTGGGKILDNVGDLLDSLLIGSALIVVHHHGEEFVADTNEIHTVLLNSLPDLTVLHEAGVKVIQAPVLPDISDFLHLASLVVLVDTVDEHIGGLLHLISGDIVLVFVELVTNSLEVLVDWLNPVTEALLGDWIILLMVHTSNGLNVRLLHDLSGNFVPWEEFLFWDLAVLRLVEESSLLSWLMVDMEEIGDPAGIDGTEEGKKCKFVHFNFYI